MLGNGPLPAKWLAGCCGEVVCSDIAAQRLSLLTIAVVVPGDDRRHGDAPPVDKDTGFTHACDANARSTGRAGGGVKCRPECFNRSSEQLLSCELNAVRRGDPWRTGAPLADDLPSIGEDDR